MPNINTLAVATFPVLLGCAPLFQSCYLEHLSYLQATVLVAQKKCYLLV